MSHSWVLGFHRRGHKGILPLEIASDLQQDKLYVFLPCLPLTHQVLAIEAGSRLQQASYFMLQSKPHLQWRRAKRAFKNNKSSISKTQNQKQAKQSPKTTTIKNQNQLQNMNQKPAAEI